MHIPSPKNHFSKDVCINQDTPIFATSKREVVYSGKHNQRDYMEDDMMATRWKVFKFKYQIPQDEQKTVMPCGTCFSKLVLQIPQDEQKVFKFKYQIPQDEQKTVMPCGTCFSKLVLLGTEL